MIRSLVSGELRAKISSVPAQQFVELVLGHPVGFLAGDHRRVLACDAELVGDGGSGQRVVAGDHDDTDAGGVAVGDGCGHLWAWWVEHRYQAQQGQLVLGFLTAFGQRLPGLEAALGDGEHAQPLSRVGVHPLFDAEAALSAQWAGAALGVRDRGAAGDDVLRGSLGVHPHAAVAFVQGGHQLEYRVEVELATAVPVAVRRGGAVAEQGCPFQQRCLGGVADRAALGVGLGVGAGRHRHGEFAQHGIARHVRRRAVQSVFPRSGPHGADLHVVLGESARLIGADHVGGAEGLHRAQPLDHRTAPHQAAYAQCQGQGDDRQQSFGDVAHQQADREHHGVLDRQAGRERREREEGQAGEQCDQRDQPGHPADLGLQRALLTLDPLGQGGDPAKLGVHTSGEHHCPRLALGAGRPAEHQVTGVQQRDMGIQQVRRPVSRHRLPGEGGEVDLDAAVHQAGIRGDPVPSSITSTSPGTKVPAPTTSTWPSLTALACTGRYAASASTARSACISCTNANAALTMITTTIATATAAIPATHARPAAAHSSSASGCVICLASSRGHRRPPRRLSSFGP